MKQTAARSVDGTPADNTHTVPEVSRLDPPDSHHAESGNRKAIREAKASG